MSEDGREFTKTVVFVNGHVVAHTSEQPRVEGTDTQGRLVVTSRVLLDLSVVNIVDDAALAAVHKRATFGLAHLKALIRALPMCAYLGEACERVATSALSTRPYCAKHAPEGALEFAYAPAAEHIESYVRAYYEEKKLPEGE